MAELLVKPTFLVTEETDDGSKDVGKVGEVEFDWLLPEVEEGEWRSSEAPATLFDVGPDMAQEIQLAVQDFQKQCTLTVSIAKAAVEADGGAASDASLSDLEKSSSELTQGEMTRGDGSSTTLRSSIHLPGLSTDHEITTEGVPLNYSAKGIIFEGSKCKPSRSAKLRRLLKGKMPMRPFSAMQELLPQSPTSSTMVECASCFEDLPSNKAVPLVCTHYYCTECFVQLVRTAMQYETFWPPKCCLQELPRRLIVKRLPDGVLKEFGAKEREFGTPAKDRWYCMRPSCGLWFEGRKFGALTRCPHCSYEMCIYCRGEKHSRHVKCPQDKNNQLLREEAELEGWRECYSCHAMVELTAGCRHITCNCKAEFCYTCGARWRTCACTEDDQVERNRRLAALRATKQKEEAEMEAALKAVAAAERREREQLILEEKRQIEVMEEARIESIQSRFATLRDELASFLETKTVCLYEAHDNEKQVLQSQKEQISTEQSELEADIETDLCAYGDLIKMRSGYHAQARNDAITRHTLQKKELSQRLQSLQESKLVSEVLATKHLEGLVLEQQRELNEIWDQQRRELDRLESRRGNIRNNPVFKERGEVNEAVIQSIEKSIAAHSRRIACDRLWIEFARTEQHSHLNEQEQRAINDGEIEAAASLATLQQEVAKINEEIAAATAEEEALEATLNSMPGPSQNPVGQLHVLRETMRTGVPPRATRRNMRRAALEQARATALHHSSLEDLQQKIAELNTRAAPIDRSSLEDLQRMIDGPTASAQWPLNNSRGARLGAQMTMIHSVGQ